MAQDILEGNWKKISGQLKNQWGKITDDELKEAEGSRSKIIGILQEKYGYAKRKAEEELESFLDNTAENVDSIKEKVSQSLNNFSEGMTENFDQMKEQVKEYSGVAKEYIEERPLKAVLVAAGIGLVLGALLAK